MVGWILIGLKWGPRGGGQVTVDVLDDGRIFTDHELLDTRIEDTALDGYAQVHVKEVNLESACDGCWCRDLANLAVKVKEFINE